MNPTIERIGRKRKILTDYCSNCNRKIKPNEARVFNDKGQLVHDGQCPQPKVDVGPKVIRGVR